MTRVTGDWLTGVAAQRVCAVLTDAGYQAWFVGGCVRNALIGQDVRDLDLSTNARPELVMELARDAGIKVVPTGIDHGTVTLVLDGTSFEVTTFRQDVATDGRRAVVAFADTMIEDARRRDFTMNALYAGPDGAVADPLGGLPDLFARRVRFIEDADRRIKEDYLRILRFFRFHAWYGDPEAGIDADGLAACADNIDGLAALSAERITAEVLRLLAAPDPAPAVASMAATGALAQVLAGAEAGGLAVLVHLEQAAGVQPAPLRRLAVLGGQTDGLRLSKDQARELGLMMAEGDLPELAYRHGFAAARDAALIRAALAGGKVGHDDLAALQDAARKIFPLTAADLMPGLQGAALGRALRQAEARWIASGFTLTKDDLLG
ncbi:CCA tRNA nucleotidyltransferase [Yoonia sp.]|uniref:CCA tRNA nucleotidyltransferase n=1 Tax=Yoonia sp. TaxID=2212373 RepID=UPI002FDB6477